MSTKTIYVFRGPCGSGKSWFRNHLAQGLPYQPYVIDMADAPRKVSVQTRSEWMIEKIETTESGTVIFLEAIFAPYSPSLRNLRDYCIIKDIELIEITVNRSLESILRAIPKEDVDRRKFASEYHPKFI